MQPSRTTNSGRTMEMKAAALRCQLLLILLMSAVMLLPGTNGSLLLVQRTVTRTIVLQETIGKGKLFLCIPEEEGNPCKDVSNYGEESGNNMSNVNGKVPTEPSTSSEILE
ncbi:hypothetical protein STEG23_034413 [Scotinomys teguina]